MILDNNLVLSAAQVVTATADSDNVIDTLAAGDAITPNSGARIRCTTKVTCTDSGSNATLTFALLTSADNITYVTLAATGAIAFAAFATAGMVVLDTPIPTGARRYLKASYTIASGPLTAGSFDAEILANSEKLLDRNL